MFVAALCLLLLSGRGLAEDVDEKDVVVLGDKNFTDEVKKAKYALVRSCTLPSASGTRRIRVHRGSFVTAV